MTKNHKNCHYYYAASPARNELMKPISTDVAHRCLCVYPCGITVSCAEMAKPINMLFGQQICVSRRNLALNGSPNPHRDGHLWRMT